MLTRRALLGAGAALALGACRRRAEGALVVLAAASLREVLTACNALAMPRVGAVELRCDASARLARQVDAGMRGDVFVSADREWVDWLVARGHAVASSARVLAGNQLVVVAPAGDASPALASPADLARAPRLALAAESVPAGRYARASLRSLGAWEGVRERVLEADSVRAALGYVARGEAPFGVVYATDARVEPRVRVALELPAASHPEIVYVGCVLGASVARTRAEGYLATCASEAGRGAFASAGFVLR